MTRIMYTVPPVYLNTWRGLIKAAKEADIDTDSDHAIKLMKMCWDWPTCAVGEAVQDIKELTGRKRFSIKKYPVLSSLGGDFLGDVDLCQWDRAEETIRKIEAEASHIQAQIRGIGEK